MMSEFKRRALQQEHDTAAETWSDGFCTTDWCRADRWAVQRDANRRDLWLVATTSGDTSWQIAATTPACPLCGANLSPHVEGVGEVLGAADNPLATYARRLAA